MFRNLCLKYTEGSILELDLYLSNKFCNSTLEKLSHWRKELNYFSELFQLGKSDGV